MAEQELVETTIKDMAVGQVGYTQHWAVYGVPNDLRLTALAIRGDYDATDRPFGTSNVRIEMRSGGVVAADMTNIDLEKLNAAPIQLDWDWLAVIPLPQEA